MRKTLLLTLEWPPMRGGIAEYLSGLFAALPKDRTAVHCDDAALYRSKMPMRWLASLPDAFRAAKREKAEIIVVSHVLPMGYIALIMRILCGFPYVVIVHGMDLKTAASSPWKRFWAGAILRRAHAVVANSASTVKIAHDLYVIPEERLCIVYPCPSAPAMRRASAGEVAALRRRLGLDGKRVIVSVGRLVRRKGFDLVIDALPKLRKFCGDIVYVIVGSGPEDASLRDRAAARGVADHVRFAGDVAPDDLPAWYRLGDVFIMTPRDLQDDVEGFGIVYLEAGLHGLPVIGSRAGGVPEAVEDGETGILVPPEDEDALFEAACELLNAPEHAAKLGRGGRERVMARFTCAAQAEEFKRALS